MPIDISPGGRPGGVPTHIVVGAPTNSNAQHTAKHYGPTVRTVDPVGWLSRRWKQAVRKAAQ